MLALLSCAFCMASCDVHEFPDIPEKRAFHLRLNYDTDMTEWKHLYDGARHTTTAGHTVISAM